MVSTVSRAGWPAASIALRMGAIGDRQPVAVSLCSTQTALISCALSLRRCSSITAGAPIGGDEFGPEAELDRHVLPQGGELAGLDHQHAVPGGERVDQGALPGA